MSWLDELKVGDKVIVSFGIHSVGKIDTVTAVGKLHVTVGGSKYRKQSGLLAGAESWNRDCIQEATPDAIMKVLKQQAVEKLSRQKWESLPFQTLEKILELAKGESA